MEQRPLVHHRKRRRRRPGKPSISARLVLDEHLKGDVGIISSDLFADLFPSGGAVHAQDGEANSKDDSTSDTRMCHVAIAPWMPESSFIAEEARWTIIPVRVPSSEEAKVKTLSPSTINFSANSTALQSLAQNLSTFGPARSGHKGRAPIEIRVLDVVPVGLDTVLVAVNDEVAQTLTESGQHGRKGSLLSDGSKKSFSGRQFAKSRGVQNRKEPSIEQRISEAVRRALRSPRIVRSGDLLSLPLPSHPITHLPPAPVKIAFCDPVGQGVLLPQTRIIITRAQEQHNQKASAPLFNKLFNVSAEEDEDTSDDRFFSAAEDRSNGLGSSPEGDASEDPSESDAEGGDASDDSLEDIISLQSPQISQQTPNVLSAFQPGTPRGPGGGQRTAGIATPGSVFSNYTATTARPGGYAGRLFVARGLLDRIPDEALFPKPNSEEDDEARVFVPVGTLAKLGCFSGDWVKLETAAEPETHPLGSWGMGAFDNSQGHSESWRAAKVYGLPEAYGSRTPNIAPPKLNDHVSGPRHFRSLPLTVYLSPILLANLQEPSHLRIIPLSAMSRSGVPNSRRNQFASSSLPPMAKEVTLLKVSTPSSTERNLQGPLLAGLRLFFEGKRRLVKTGDLVGINIDESLGRLLYQGSSQSNEDGDELIPSLSNGHSAHRRSSKMSVAWFKVGQVAPSPSRTADDIDNDWGGVAVIDSGSTRMVQAGSDKSKLPGTLENTWQYYMGLKHAPISDSGVSHTKELLPDSSLFVPPLQRRLKELVAAATSPRAAQLGLPPLAILLVSTQRNIGKATIAKRACEDLGIHIFNMDAYDILTEGGAGGGDVKTEALLKARSERALSCGPEFCALLIRHIEALTAERTAAALGEVISDSRVLLATTTDVDKIPENVRSLFTHELEMNAPDEKEREGLLRNIMNDLKMTAAAEVDLAGVAVKTAALVAGDLVDVVQRASLARRERLEELVLLASLRTEQSQDLDVRDLEIAGGEASRCLTKTDFEVAVDAARKNFADAIGAPKIPNVSWDDVGGLSNVKDAVMETIQLPLERPELFAKGMKKRSGILFYGPPGTGKTLLAKAIATEFSLNFFSIKGPELLNMYIGESEANVRRVFQRARDARPCVVFFDELDSVAPKRGNQGDSGGVMDRIVSQLLAELDGMSNGEEGAGGVFVIGATNRPDLLDSALLRPGRFDKMLYLGISDTHEKQLTILEALTRKFNLDPSLSLRQAAESLPFTYTGADLYALCSDAMLKAITRQADAVDRKIKARPGKPITPAYFFDHLATKEDTTVMVRQDDFAAAQRELVGSVSAKELEHYARVRKTFETVDSAPRSSLPLPAKNAAGSLPNGNSQNRQQKPLTSSETKFSSRGKAKVTNSSSGLSRHSSTTTTTDDSDTGLDRFYEPGSVGTEDEEDEEDDDNVIRTDHLMNGHENGSLNGSAKAGEAQSKGKGKEKAIAADGEFEDPSRNDEEELYG
ncbi:MAG: hypothetical protein M4579_006497 [Chaenotheca gracillima]|nr:MAG: hypothetical protein M4579_006497 [Chaenotheca gracillima]